MNHTHIKTISTLLSLFLAVIFFSCTGSQAPNRLSMSYDSFPRKIEIPEPSKDLTLKFNREIKGEKREVKKPGGKIISGYVTQNREFFEEVIKPILLPHLEELKSMPKHQMINTLTLFIHELFQKYFGKDFYRWGGDMFDLDDPQSQAHRFDARYGLDCSGFSTSPYELAVYFSLLNKEDFSAVFSSRGFEIYCAKNKIEDKGGLDGGGNNFRVDTRELAALGKEIFRIEKGGTPTDEQTAKLQAGDLVGRNGHFGIIVDIGGEPYYLESGGWVVPRTGGNPYHAKEALAMFAKNGIVMVRRSLPNKAVLLQ